MEAIEPGPVEGIRATGANKLEEILYGVLPQVMPLLISYSLYRFESNVRSATVVGMVGAGGIGVTLWEAIRGFQFQQTCALMVLSSSRSACWISSLNGCVSTLSDKRGIDIYALVYTSDQLPNTLSGDSRKT